MLVEVSVVVCRFLNVSHSFWILYQVMLCLKRLTRNPFDLLSLNCPFYASLVPEHAKVSVNSLNIWGGKKGEWQFTIFTLKRFIVIMREQQRPLDALRETHLTFLEQDNEWLKCCGVVAVVIEPNCSPHPCSHSSFKYPLTESMSY